VAARFIHYGISAVPRALSFLNSDFLSNKISQSNRICLNIPRTNLNVFNYRRIHSLLPITNPGLLSVLVWHKPNML
jgi:hypothetical protein